MKWATALLIGSTSACVVVPGNEYPASPQRPTLSSDTSTTIEGTFEHEMGGAWDPDQFFDTPTGLKFGSGPSTEVFLSWSPFVYLQFPGEDEVGPGDLGIGLRHRFLEETDSSPSAAVQATVKLPTANDRERLGTGELDSSFAGILSQGLGAYVLTGFYSLDVLGTPTGGTDLGHSVPLASSTPIFDRVGGFGELAGVFVPEQHTEEVFTTLGLTYSPAARLVFDVAVVVGLSDEAPDFQLVFGFTRNLGRWNFWN